MSNAARSAANRARQRAFASDSERASRGARAGGEHTRAEAGRVMSNAARSALRRGARAAAYTREERQDAACRTQRQAQPIGALASFGGPRERAGTKVTAVGVTQYVEWARSAADRALASDRECASARREQHRTRIRASRRGTTNAARSAANRARGAPQSAAALHVECSVKRC